MKTEIVKQLIEKSKALGLMGLVFLSGFGIEDVLKAYNGIGPQFLPENLRDKAATEYEAAFWQSLLDIIPVPN